MENFFEAIEKHKETAGLIAFFILLLAMMIAEAFEKGKK